MTATTVKTLLNFQGHFQEEGKRSSLILQGPLFSLERGKCIHTSHLLMILFVPRLAEQITHGNIARCKDIVGRV